MNWRLLYKLALIFVIFLTIMLLPRVAYDYSPAFRLVTIVLSTLRVLLLAFLWIEIVGILIQYIIKPSRPGWVKQLATVLFAVCTILILLEGIFMFIGRSHYAGYTLNAKVWFFRHWKPINEYGYRDDTPRPGKRFTIFVVGDSYTAGHGLKNYQNRYSNLLGKRLASEDSSIQVINLGSNGSETRDEYIRMQKFEEESGIHPNLVILQYFGNDIEEVAKDHGMAFMGFARYADLKYGLSNFVESSYLLNCLYWMYPHGDVKPYVEYLMTTYADSAVFHEHLTDLQRFIDFSRQRNIPLLVVIFPFLQDEKLSKTMYIDKIRSFLDLNQIEYVDVSEMIGDMPVPDRVINTNDAHPNERVNQRVAESLEKVIRSKKLLYYGIP